jgi:hypothetical protein
LSADADGTLAGEPERSEAGLLAAGILVACGATIAGGALWRS